MFMRSETAAYVLQGSKIKRKHRFFCQQLLFDAVDAGELELARTLLDRGVKADITREQRKKGRTPLVTAIGRGDTAMVALLADHRANINRGTSVSSLIDEKDQQVAASLIGEQPFPLMFAVWLGDENMVKTLMECGVDCQLERSSGFCQTPLECAIVCGKAAIVKLLAKWQHVTHKGARNLSLYAMHFWGDDLVDYLEAIGIVKGAISEKVRVGLLINALCLERNVFVMGELNRGIDLAKRYRVKAPHPSYCGARIVCLGDTFFDIPLLHRAALNQSHPMVEVLLTQSFFEVSLDSRKAARANLFAYLLVMKRLKLPRTVLWRILAFDMAFVRSVVSILCGRVFPRRAKNEMWTCNPGQVRRLREIFGQQKVLLRSSVVQYFQEQFVRKWRLLFQSEYEHGDIAEELGWSLSWKRMFSQYKEETATFLRKYPLLADKLEVLQNDELYCRMKCNIEVKLFGADVKMERGELQDRKASLLFHSHPSLRVPELDHPAFNRPARVKSVAWIDNLALAWYDKSWTAEEITTAVLCVAFILTAGFGP